MVLRPKAIIFLVISIALLSMNAVSGNTVIFSENFDRYPSNAPLPENWWYEGSKATFIDSGHLRIDAHTNNSGEDKNVGCAWLDRVFSGDLQVEYDAHILDSDGPVNDIVLFFLYSDPNGDTLRSSADTRMDGDWSKYTENLNGHTIIYWSKDNITEPANFRLYENPSMEKLMERNQYEIQAGKTYHIKVTKVGNKMDFFVDGNSYLSYTDESGQLSDASGYLGFRTWKTDLWFDNLDITQL